MKTAFSILNTSRILILALSIFSLSFNSCKKSNSDTDSAEYKVQNEVRDSAYLYTKDIYLWNEKLPSIEDFKPRDSKDVYALMDKVRSYQPLDKWSFVETKAETEQSQKGNSDDFGFMVRFVSTTDIRVTYVYSNSSAGSKGVKRTWRVNKINGRVINRGVERSKCGKEGEFDSGILIKVLSGELNDGKSIQSAKKTLALVFRIRRRWCACEVDAAEIRIFKSRNLLFYRPSWLPSCRPFRPVLHYELR